MSLREIVRLLLDSLSGRAYGVAFRFSRTFALDQRTLAMDENVNRLKRICRETVDSDEFKAHDITGDGIPETFCNRAVHTICQRFASYFGFYGLNANQIYDRCQERDEWQKESGEWASQWALGGGLAVAVQRGRVHGHCAVVFPCSMVESQKWKKNTVMIANAGKKNGIMSCALGFRDEPEYFIFKDRRRSDEVV